MFVGFAVVDFTTKYTDYVHLSSLIDQTNAQQCLYLYCSLANVVA